MRKKLNYEKVRENKKAYDPGMIEFKQKYFFLFSEPLSPTPHNL